jgi:hypothetical protein
MGEKLVIGPINKGLKTYFTPFNIDNDSFPVLQNAYQWRGRVKRKRGTTYLGQLNYQYVSFAVFTGFGISGPTKVIGLFANTGKLNPGPSASFVPGNIKPITITFTGSVTNQTLTDTLGTGVLSISPAGNITAATLNYSTGNLTITLGTPDTVSIFFSGSIYPGLPVMGLEDFTISTEAFPGTIAFDTQYSYNISTTSPYPINYVGYYNNPAAAGKYPGYVPKAITAATPFTWNGADYQQFWSTNYQGALWVTNGVPVPFVADNIGMPFKPILTVTNITGGPPAIARLTLDVTGGAHNLVKGDFVFVNQVSTTTGINFQTGYVISNNPQNANFVDVEFPTATIATNGTGGIAQYLTNVPANWVKDCIRWYNGDPTNGTGIPAANDKGWVNFCPPLSQGPFSIADLPADIYYLVSAKIILPFKDRLIFIGPVVQTSTGIPIYLQDTVIYSQNGTPYYTTSFTGNPINPTIPPGITYMLVPDNQSASATAYWQDQTGFGGFVSAGLDQPINTASSNEDVLIMGLSTLQVRFVYTGNDIIPFNFFVINSELGSSSTFSAVNTDQGVISRGSRGYTIAAQTTVQRIDIDIPDEVFEMALTNNGAERVCAQRDFINEWIYFTYSSNGPSNGISYNFPSKTLQFNYRDNSWGFFYENYTTYGQFIQKTGITWLTTGYSSWNAWTTPWNAGDETLLQPKVIAGNQQGFVLFRDEGTDESKSLTILGITGNTISSINHCLNTGDYITTTGALGTNASLINGQVFSIQVVDNNSFTLNPDISGMGIVYGGSGYIIRMYVPFITTKQFPTSWGLGRKTRLGIQQYLLTKTPNSQIQLLIYLSTDDDTAYNDGPILPNNLTLNDSLLYSTVLYTCPESTNLGLTPMNVNLQQLNALDSAGNTSNGQQQIWHRVNTSLIGDTVQLGFTMSDAQMRDVNLLNQFAEIELHGIILDVSPSMTLS